VISCTALPTADLVDEMQAFLEIPVITTNRALAESITRRLASLRSLPDGTRVTTDCR